jgi:hypothetical protein
VVCNPSLIFSSFIRVIRIVRVIVVIIFGRSVRDICVIITSDGIDGLRIAGICVSQLCGLYLSKRTCNPSNSNKRY